MLHDHNHAIRNRSILEEHLKDRRQLRAQKDFNMDTEYTLVDQLTVWDSTSLAIVKIEDLRLTHIMLRSSARLALVFIRCPQPGNTRQLGGGGWRQCSPIL